MTAWLLSLTVADALPATTLNPANATLLGAFSGTRLTPSNFLSFPETAESLGVAEIGAGGIDVF